MNISKNIKNCHVNMITGFCNRCSGLEKPDAQVDFTLRT